MTHKLKTLGVALAAVLALTAVMASAAAAKNYTASSYPITATGTSAVGNGTLKTEAGTVECGTHWQLSLSFSSSSVTVTPTATNCKAFGFVSATVNMNGCDLLGTTASGTAPNFTAAVDVVCPAGKTIEITAGTCKATIGSQGPLNNVAITNTGGTSVNVKSNVAGIAYTVVTDGFGCPFSGTGAKAGAAMTHHSAISVASTNGANIHVG